MYFTCLLDWSVKSIFFGCAWDCLSRVMQSSGVLQYPHFHVLSLCSPVYFHYLMHSYL